MKYGSLILEKNDFLMTRKFMGQNPTLEDYVHASILETLEQNLKNAVVMDAGNMPLDIVRLYSKVTIVGPLNQRDSFLLVPPEEVGAANGLISVVSSLGASIIGFSKGDRIPFGLPGNRITFKIEEVEQGVQKVKLSISDRDIEKMIPGQ